MLGAATLDDEGTTEAILGALATAPMPSPEGFWAQADACLGHDARGRAGRIGAPALVLRGRDDALVPAPASEELASLLPGGRVEVLPGGHAFLLESAAAAGEAVARFLRGVEGGP